MLLISFSLCPVLNEIQRYHLNDIVEPQDHIATISPVPVDAKFYYEQCFKPRPTGPTATSPSPLPPTLDAQPTVPQPLPPTPQVTKLKGGNLFHWFSKATPEEYAASQKRQTRDWEAVMEERSEQDQEALERAKCQKTELATLQKRRQRVRELEEDIRTGRRDANGHLVIKKVNFLYLLPYSTNNY